MIMLIPCLSLSLHGQCPLQWFLVFSTLSLLKPITPSATKRNVSFPTPILIVKFLQVFKCWVELVLPLALHSELSPFFCHDYSLLLLSYLRRIVIRTLPAVPVDNIYRISIIFHFTVLPQSLYANLYLALVYTFYFWPLVQIVRYGPIVRTLLPHPASLKKESVAPPSSSTHTFKTTELETVTKSQNKYYFSH